MSTSSTFAPLSEKQAAAKQHIGWNILSGLLALAFLLAGGNKLTGPADMIAGFEAMGLPAWFLYVTGAVEVVGAVLIALPKTRAFGALLLVGTMTGAVMAHALNAHPFGQWIAALVLLSLSGLVTWSQRDKLRALTKAFVGASLNQSITPTCRGGGL